MIESPRIVVLPARVTAKIYQVIPRSQIQTEMGKTLRELSSAIADQSIAITGTWFTHHLKPPGEQFDFEVCFPVASTVKPAGRMQPGEWPAMTVVQTVYHGGYEGLGSGWGEFMKWIADNGHKVSPEIWERYLVGPESGSDSSKWRTELNRMQLPAT